MAEINHQTALYRVDHEAVLDALLADITAIRTQVVALVADVTGIVAEWNTLTTKLNADAGVTDTNYAAATAKTAVNPAALTTTT